jgi:hypothetical protein
MTDAHEIDKRLCAPALEEFSITMIATLLSETWSKEWDSKKNLRPFNSSSKINYQVSDEVHNFLLPRFIRRFWGRNFFCFGGVGVGAHGQQGTETC